MYTYHKRILFLSFFTVGFLSYFLNIPFEKIASDSITVVSIAIAVYMTAITLLIGNKIVESMGKTDSFIKTKTKLGVLVTYLKSAVLVGVLSILDCCFLKIYTVEDPNQLEGCFKNLYEIYKIVSAIGLALFITTLLFMLLIFKFIATTILNQSRQSGE